jgi:hypothetical protein
LDEIYYHDRRFGIFDCHACRLIFVRRPRGNAWHDEGVSTRPIRAALRERLAPALPNFAKKLPIVCSYLHERRSELQADRRLYQPSGKKLFWDDKAAT